MCDFFWDKAGVSSAGEGDLSDIIRAAQPAVQPEPSMWHFPGEQGASSSAEQLGASSSGGNFGDPFAGKEDASFDDIQDDLVLEEIKGNYPYDVIRVSPVAENLGAASSAGPSIAPPLRAPPANKRRKGQTKKVVCIPAPVAAASSTSAPATASGRPINGSEVVPSDLWAWRKYGQKPIKGSPYPRGYYRCSSSKGCSARKQVERSRTDPNMLVITYTSEHNHPWPTHRNTPAGSSRGGQLSKPLSLNSANPNLTQTLIPPSHVRVRDELDKMTNMLRMPLPSDVLFKQEMMEAGAREGIFWGLTSTTLEPDPVSLILSSRGLTEAKQGEESGEKGAAIDPFSLF